VGAPELLQRGVNDLAANYGNVVAAAIVIAAIYILINSLLTMLANWLDRRSRRRGAKKPVATNTPVIVQDGAELTSVGTPKLGALEPQG
jgi:glutamate transport system permease protein